MTAAIAALTATTPALAAETAALVERLRRSVVAVRDGGRGAASGVIWQDDGVIVTNHHVAPGRSAHVTLPDGREYLATVRLRDPAYDLAVLEIDARGLPAVRAGDSDRLRVGELVFAVGNPLGLPRAVTAGIISAAPRPAGREASPRAMVQADVSLAPGNSGGLLATADGGVVGINSMVRAPGLALAVPSNAVRDLLRRGESGRAYFGVTLVGVELPGGWLPRPGPAVGFAVTSVARSSPAEAAGIIVGDLLVSLAGRPLASLGVLERELASLRPGGEVEVGFIRGGRPRSATVLTGRMESEAA